MVAEEGGRHEDELRQCDDVAIEELEAAQEVAVHLLAAEGLAHLREGESSCRR